MAVEKFAHIAATTVVSGGSDAPAAGTVQTWTVASSAGFPDVSDNWSEFRVVDSVAYTEVIRVTAISGVTWTVTRGADGTTPVTHAANFTVSNVISAATVGKLAARPLPVTEASAFIAAVASNTGPRVMQVVGDSTGNGDDEWAVLFTQWLMALYPQYTVETRLWNDARLGYDPPVLRQVGTAGLRRYVSSGALTDRNFNVADSVMNSVTGDQTIDFKLKFNGLPAGVFDLLSKFGGAGQRSWRILFTTTGTFQFSTTSDGTTEVTRVSTAAVPLAQRNAATWYRVRIDVDNGAAGNTVSFWYSSDYVTWTQLGANVVTAGITSVFDSTAPVILNGRGSSQVQLSSLEFYALRVYNGITDTTMTPVVDIDVAQFYSYNNTMFTSFQGMCGETVTGFTTTTGSFVGAPVITLFNGSHPGASFTYLNANFTKMVATVADLAIVSTGYNDDPLTYRASYKTMLDALKAKMPNAGIYATSQGRSNAPVSQSTIDGRHMLNAMVPSIAKVNGVGLVDYFKTISATASPDSWTLDGTHPIPAASIIWAGVLENQFLPYL